MPRSAVPKCPEEVTTASPCTCLRLRKISRQFTNLYDQQLAPYGLTVNQFSLLAHLRALEGIGIGTLAEAMVIDPTALTRALRPLERDGLVRFASGTTDKRARCLHLTDKGRAAYDAARPGWRLAQQHIDGLLQANGMTGLNGILDGLIAQMKSDPVPGSGPKHIAEKDSA
jgi:DNA-binding MarR family transcriptional regulator